MFADTQKRISLRRLEAQVQDIEARREAIIATILEHEERRLEDGQAAVPELDGLCEQADRLRDEIAHHAALLRGAMLVAEDELRASQLRGAGRAVQITPGMMARMVARFLSAGAKQLQA